MKVAYDAYIGGRYRGAFTTPTTPTSCPTSTPAPSQTLPSLSGVGSTPNGGEHTDPMHLDDYWRAVLTFVLSALTTAVLAVWLFGRTFGEGLIVGAFAPLAVLLVAYILLRWDDRRLRRKP